MLILQSSPTIAYQRLVMFVQLGTEVEVNRNYLYFSSLVNEIASGSYKCEHIFSYLSFHLKKTQDEMVSLLIREKAENAVLQKLNK